MKKWDGHTHTEFCKHGSGEKTALMIEKAIKCGFEQYSITEHAPLPDGIIDDPELAADFSLFRNELPDYFKHIKELKKTYGNRITILSGLEVDFIVGYENYLLDLIDEFQSNLEDLIVSLHFIKGKNGICPVDYTPEVFESELFDYYGSVDAIHRAYWLDMEKLVTHNYRNIPNKRIGHLALVNKYVKRFPIQSPDINTIPFFEHLFKLIKQYNWSLDYNVAGRCKALFKGDYLTEPMLFWCRNLGIDLVYGSDAHGIGAIGMYYDVFLRQHLTN